MKATAVRRVSQSAPGTGRRPVRAAVIAIALVVVAAIMLNAVAGWYFSDEVLRVARPDYRVTVESVNGSTVTLSRNTDTIRPIHVGLTWPGGHAVLDTTVRVAASGVVRSVVTVDRGSLRAGLHAYLDWDVFGPDPLAGRGLDFRTVSIASDLGDLPAWYVPPTAAPPTAAPSTAAPPTAATARTTWVIAVHGRGASRQETMRALPTLAAAGVPTLAITYRNDSGAPAGPDHWYHLGDTEWRDVAAAVRYAHAHGATGVILYGWSMGGTLVLTALRRMASAEAGLVRGMVLDSPVVDWTATLDLQGAERRLPGFLTWTAERLVEHRAGLSLPGLDALRYPDQPRVPVLMYVDRSDRTVPPAPSLRYAQARPNIVTLVTTTGGNHTGSWNVDPSRYEAALAQYLHAVA